MTTRHLLIVDDDESILFAMDDYFVHHGWSVDCAQTLEMAKSLLSGHHYDAVITDVHLTGSRAAEGLELVSYLREHSGAKVIVLTAYGSEEIEQAARRRGTHAFLEKTISIQQIATVVERLTAPEVPSRE